MKTIDISGFGGGYEATCQKMLANGRAFHTKHPDFDFRVYQSNPQIYGVCIGEGVDAKALDTAIMENIDDATGAMHHAVISHLAYIHKNGYEGWIDEGRKQGCTVYETTSEQIENTILFAQIEWQLKLDGGYNPMAEMFKSIPPENIFTFNPNDPESVKDIVEKIAQILKGEN